MTPIERMRAGLVGQATTFVDQGDASPCGAFSTLHISKESKDVYNATSKGIVKDLVKIASNVAEIDTDVARAYLTTVSLFAQAYIAYLEASCKYGLEVDAENTEALKSIKVGVVETILAEKQLLFRGYDDDISIAFGNLLSEIKKQYVEMLDQYKLLKVQGNLKLKLKPTVI